MTAAVIVLALSLLILSILITVAGAKYVDLMHEHLRVDAERTRLLVDKEALQAEIEARDAIVSRSARALSETTEKLRKAQADQVATMPVAELLNLVNGGVHSDADSPGPSAGSGSAEEVTAVYRLTAAGESRRPGGSL